MCGIAGYLGGSGQNEGAENFAILKRMTDSIVHRGPDDAGYWQDPSQQIYLGHRRLSILDLSPAGHQPMQSASGRYMVIFNGEIYNHLLLRQQLDASGQAPQWRGHADTETLLAGFDAWGVRATVERATGMFAIAVWDRAQAVLTLVRDRVGEKPLYYGWQGTGRNAVFLFGSELKALRAHPAFVPNIDRGALCLQLRHNYIPAPYSIYEGIAKLPPGTILNVSLRMRDQRAEQYWSGSGVAESGLANTCSGDAEHAVDALETLLKDAVRQQMMSDVPLGAFLSGGVDSSTVVALMQAQSSRPVKTFSIGFHEKSYNEAEYAKAVASHIGTDHTELYVSAQQAQAVIPKLPGLYDEPFSDSSQIPAVLVSELAKQHVTVCLSGDAGDELFCGYTRYLATAKLWNRLMLVPPPLRKLAGKAITSVSPKSWDALAAATTSILPQSMQYSNVGDKLHKGAGVLGSSSIDALYFNLTSHWPDPASVVLGAEEPRTLQTTPGMFSATMSPVERMMALDMLTYLPDDILVKVDRAAMGLSLETRVPFLDHRVVEFAWKLPLAMKLRDGTSKWVLRQILYRHVPRQLIERPKMGFGVPIGEWLRGPLRDWAESLLEPARLRGEGFLHVPSITRKWKEHISGQRNWQYHLWDVLMFQAWLAQQSSALPIVDARPVEDARPVFL